MDADKCPHTFTDQARGLRERGCPRCVAEEIEHFRASGALMSEELESWKRHAETLKARIEELEAALNKSRADHLTTVDEAAINYTWAKRWKRVANIHRTHRRELWKVATWAAGRERLFMAWAKRWKAAAKRHNKQRKNWIDLCNTTDGVLGTYMHKYHAARKVAKRLRQRATNDADVIEEFGEANAAMQAQLEEARRQSDCWKTACESDAAKMFRAMAQRDAATAMAERLANSLRVFVQACDSTAVRPGSTASALDALVSFEEWKDGQ